MFGINNVNLSYKIKLYNQNFSPMKKQLFLLQVLCFITTLVNAQNIGINGTGATPNASSILDLNTGNTFTSPNGKGFLPPKLALTGVNDLVTVTSPATSLLVYNTATAGSGSLAVTPGYYYFDGTKWVAFSGNGSNDWALLGNAGTNASSNFVGTTDNVPLNFRVNNQKAGRIEYTSATSNTFFGYQAGNTITTGFSNLGVGKQALYGNTFGNNNIAIGTSALYTNTGNFNLAVGTEALYNSTIGFGNIAIGANSLRNNTTGRNNISLGYMSSNLIDNTIVNSPNIVIGSEALTGGSSTAALNTTNGNVVIGYQAMFGTSGTASTGYQNVAVGNLALQKITGGFNNTAIGKSSLDANLTGSDNTALGISTGSTNITGHRHTLVGAYADVSASNLVNATAIGYNAKVGQNNSLILGGTGADQVKVGIGTTTPTEQFTIENGDMQMGESLAVPGVGRRMFFSDVANNSFDPIFFQRENLASDVSSLNLNIGDNYRAPAAAAPDRFNVGAGYTAGVFNSILTVETKNARVGVNTIDPIVELQVVGQVESSYRSASTLPLNAHYSQLSADGALRLRRNPAAPTFTSSNGYIDFVNDAGTGYDFRLSYERDKGPLGAMAFSDNANTHMTIAQGTGRVGIKSFSPGGLFELGFDEGRKPSTSSWTIVSDERLKTIKGNYTKGLKEILQLNTITYYYRNAGERQFQPEVLKNLNVGYSAQEVQKIFPEAVGVDDDGYLNLNMHAILVAYTNAIKEQQTQIDEQQKQILELRKQNEEILKLLRNK